ncbi:MAG TPA: c-type cytochrome [Vicinamibacterales bacterium]|nr:c-type cytochrome [Vicinamibacterales bacterium]
MKKSFWRRALVVVAACHVSVLAGVSLMAAQSPVASQKPPALPTPRTGEDIFRATCATCHGLDGRGSPRSVVGFEAALPDFTDCGFASAESHTDWRTVVHEGGPIRGLDRHMPAFGDALSKDDIANVVTYVKSFCTNTSWPQGDLNFPRAFFTEKAYPESETVFVTSVSGRADKEIEQAVEYEHRIGPRGQVMLEAPVAFNREDGVWTRGLADVEVGYKHTLFSSLRSGTIISASAIMTLPTGNPDRGLGDDVVIYEPVVHAGQRLPGMSFVQAAAGLEFPSNTTNVSRSAYVNVAAGKSFAMDRGFGRLWTPQVELLWAREKGGDSSWDVAPSLQVSLSKIQHIRAAVGARIPVTERDSRHTQFVFYLLWDWADGGFLEFWR